MNNQKIVLKLKSYDHSVLDGAVEKIVSAAHRTGAVVKGPVPLPRNIYKITVNRSTHVNKKSREQFEIRVHERLIYILEPSLRTMETLMKLDLPSGVEVEIKANKKDNNTGSTHGNA